MPQLQKKISEFATPSLAVGPCGLFGQAAPSLAARVESHDEGVIPVVCLINLRPQTAT